MKKYYYIILGVFNEYMAYRLNFLLWRFRMMIQLFVVFALWHAIYESHTTIFGYTEHQMLTYILLTSVVRSVVLSSTTQQIGAYINDGTLSNYLLRPVHFVKVFIARDTSDKLLNSMCSLVEITILFFLFRPHMYIQSDWLLLLLSCISLVLGIAIYFFYSMFFSLIGFWTADIWALRFISFIFLEFFSGTLYPLDILPKPIFWVSQILPFSYCVYQPIRTYIGGASYPEVVSNMVISVIWVVLFWLGTMRLWHRGLRRYAAEGR